MPISRGYSLNVACAAIAYAFVWTAFFAKIEVTDDEIIGVGWHFKAIHQRRDQLCDIKTGERDQTYILRFETGRKIRFPRMMSRRTELLELLERQIEANRFGEFLDLPLVSDAKPSPQSNCEADSVTRTSGYRSIGRGPRRVN